MDVPRSGTLLHSGKHAICFRRSTVYSTFSVFHSAEFYLFEAVYPLPFGHPLLQGGTHFTLTQNQLSKSLFPLGQLTKKEVRDIAKKIGLKVASKPDRKEICFIQDNNYKGYIEENSSNKSIPGEFISKDGTILGYHKGISNYTIGQRRGLGIVTGSPMFVIDIIPETNQIVLGSQEELLSKELIVRNPNWISIENLTEEKEVEVKIRYRAKESKAKIIPLGNDSVKVIFKSPQRAITKGQSAVFYNKDVVVGGGIIS